MPQEQRDGVTRMQILMVLTDAFGGFGGIAKFNRDFLGALSASSRVERIYAWPRLIPEAVEGRLPEAVVYERKLTSGKLRYITHVAASLFIGPQIDLVICGHINLLQAAWLVAKAQRVPLVLIIHGIDAWRPTKSFWTNSIAGKVDALLTVSMVSANRFIRWSGLPKHRCTVVPNCVDLDRFTPGPKSSELMSRYGLTGGPVLLTLGRLASEERCKGFDEVLNALPKLKQRFPSIKYLIVGDGPDGPRLRQHAKALGVADHVIFAGRIAESEKVEHYRLADVYVMPSSGEGFGIVLIEAASCGIPVVGSKVDGSAEALLQGRLGALITPSDSIQLINAVSAALDSPDIGVRTTNPLIETYGRTAYNRRVIEWIETMPAVKCLTPNEVAEN